MIRRWIRNIFTFYFLLFTFFSFAENSSGKEDQNQYSGVVLLNLETLKFLMRTSAIFIDSNFLLTTANVIQKVEGSLEGSVSFTDPKTGKFVPVSSIRHLDIENNLAILKVKDYQSPVFYPIEKNSVSYSKIDSSKEVTLVGFSLGNFRVMEGQIVSHDSSYMAILRNNYFTGVEGIPEIAGGAVFHKDTKKLFGIILRASSSLLYMTAVFSKKVRELLSQKPLSCMLEDCFEDEFNKLASRAKKGHTVSQYRLFEWYDSISDTKQALHWLQRLLKQEGFSKALALSELLSKVRISESLPLLRESAEKGMFSLNIFWLNHSF